MAMPYPSPVPTIQATGPWLANWPGSTPPPAPKPRRPASIPWLAWFMRTGELPW